MSRIVTYAESCANLQQYRSNAALRTFYNKLRTKGLQQLREAASIGDPTASQRVPLPGVALIIYFQHDVEDPGEVNRAIDALPRDLGVGSDPAIQWLPTAERHVSVMVLNPCFNTDRVDKLEPHEQRAIYTGEPVYIKGSFEQYYQAIQQVSSQTEPFYLEYRGLLCSPAAIFMPGFAYAKNTPDTSSLNVMRLAIAEAFIRAQLPFVEKMQFLSHSTVGRFAGEPGEREQLAKRIGLIEEDHLFGKMLVNSISLRYPTGLIARFTLGGNWTIVSEPNPEW